MPLPSRSPSRAERTRSRTASRAARGPSPGAVPYPIIDATALPRQPPPARAPVSFPPPPEYPNADRRPRWGSERDKTDPPIESQLIPPYNDPNRTKFPDIQMLPVPDASTTSTRSTASQWLRDQNTRVYMDKRTEAQRSKSHTDEIVQQVPAEGTEETQPVVELPITNLPNYNYGSPKEKEASSAGQEQQDGRQPMEIHAGEQRPGPGEFSQFTKARSSAPHVNGEQVISVWSVRTPNPPGPSLQGPVFQGASGQGAGCQEQAPMAMGSFAARPEERRVESGGEEPAKHAWRATGPEDWTYECCSRGFFKGRHRGHARLVAYAILVMLLAMAGARFGWKVELGEIMRRQGQHDRRLGALEQQVDAINERLQLHSASLQRLEDLLPQQIVLVRRADGKADIDPLFWHALKEKLHAEHADAATNATAANDDGDAAKNTTAPPKLPQEWRSQWEQFLESNSRRVEQAVADAYEKGQRERFSTGRLGRGQLLTKSEFMAILERKYAQLADELARVGHGFDERLRQLQQRLAEEKAEQEAVERASAHAQAGSDARHSNQRPLAAAQLEALAQLAVVANMVHATEQVNWLNPALGAFVDPRGTSPPWKGRSANVPLVQRVLAYFGHPLQTPALHGGGGGGDGSSSGSFSALEALQPWDEVGQCWCTPAAPAAGVDARITVHTARIVYLAGVTLEHAPARMTPDGARSAPRRVSLWVHTPNVAAWRRLRAEVEEHLHWGMDWAQARRGWAPAAHFAYDVRLANHVQTFPVAVDLRALDVPVDQILLRFHDNWGDVDKTCVYRIRAHGEEAKLDSA